MVVEHDEVPDISLEFQMPSLQLELHGELQGKPHGFVNIECEKFHLDYLHLSRDFTISLYDFFIEDLLHKTNDRFRYLIRSGESKEKTGYGQERGSSCPENTGLRNVEMLSKSLPNIFGGTERRSLPSSVSDITKLYLKEKQISDNGPLICLHVVLDSKDFNSGVKQV